MISRTTEVGRGALIGDDQMFEPVLYHHRHFCRVPRAQPIGDVDIRMRRVKGDEEMMRPGKSVLGDIFQNRLDQAPHRAVHQIAVIDGPRHAVIPNTPCGQHKGFDRD